MPEKYQGEAFLLAKDRPLGIDALGFQDVLRFPPGISDSSSNEGIPAKTDKVDTDSTILAQGSLVLSAPQSLSRRAVATSSQGRPNVSGTPNRPKTRELQMGSLVTEEDIWRSKGLSDKVVVTLLSDRKPNTRAIYRKTWRKCNSWCTENDKQKMDTPPILELLQQGADKGLALSTFKVQTAALSVYLERTLQKDLLVSRFCRALVKYRPSKAQKCPTWDLSVVLRGIIKSPFENNSLPIFMMKVNSSTTESNNIRIKTPQ